MSTPAKRAKASRGGSAVWPILLAVLLLGGAWAVKTFLYDGGTPKNILVMGVDEDKTRTDVVLLAHIEPREGLVNVISIPRDTLVNIPCDGLKVCVTPDKLAHAHAYGGDRGPEITVATVEHLMGIDIDGYVRLDYDGFVAAVDALGGVDIVIDQDMYYEDPYANPPLRINFEASPEPQHLDGQQALEYVRFRADGRGDIGRTERTRKFLQAMLATLRSSGKITKLPAVVEAIRPYVTTDVDLATATALARVAPKVELENLHLEQVEGTDRVLSDGRWVWLADPDKLQEQVDRLIKRIKPAEAQAEAPAK